jgi:hypothetical protein
MKLGMGLLNVPTVANSAGNHVNPWLVGMFNPAGQCFAFPAYAATALVNSLDRLS